MLISAVFFLLCYHNPFESVVYVRVHFTYEDFHI